MTRTIWELLDECVRSLSEPFRASEIVGWFRRHYPAVNERSLRTHIQGATSNASPASRGGLVGREPLITRIDHGLYQRYRAAGPGAVWSVPSRPIKADAPSFRDVSIEGAVGRYLGSRNAQARYASFDFCFNHFQENRAGVAIWGLPGGMEASCMQLGFYLASWGMLRGSSQLLQRSARHLVPLVEAIATAPEDVWDLDLDRYNEGGIDLVLRTSHLVRDALLPVEATDILVTKVMLGVFGCVPAFDTYFKKGLGVSNFSRRSLEIVGRFYYANAQLIDQLRVPTLDFTSGQPSTRLYTRAKIVDMVFFIEGGYSPSGIGDLD